MKRTPIISLLIIVLLVALSPISAANHLSVPVDHHVYRILDAGRIRGLYDENLVAVKPYTASKVIELLKEMASRPDRLRPGEGEEIARLIETFETTYGSASSGVKDLLSTGYLRSSDPVRNFGAAFGITIDSMQTVDILQAKEYDTRNGIKAFIKGDIGAHISFNMNFGMKLDRVNPHPFLPNEFTFPAEGFYSDLLHGGHSVGSIPLEGLAFGVDFAPEAAASFFDGDVIVRWANINRDWGPGLNNLLISSTSKKFDALELQINPTPWLRYSLLHGSLGQFLVGSLNGEEYVFPSDYFTGSKEDKINYRFNNNFSAHRVELDITKNLTFAIYESVVWQKRFELGYLNPFAVYMFVQNNTGDLDSMFAGIDFSYTLPRTARFYGSMAMNEMSKIGSLSTMLNAPRNMLAFQLGVVIPIPIGTFSTLTAQWTYINPFVYSHYPMRKLTGTIDATKDEKIITDTGRVITYDNSAKKFTLSETNFDPSDEITLSTAQQQIIVDNKKDFEIYDKTGRTKIYYERTEEKYFIYETYAETFYVNKGEKIGYPLEPNSQEFLLSLDLGLPKGWNAQAEVTYQVRSGQYGFDIWQFMYYAQTDSYEQTDFWAYTFEHTLSFLFGASKDLPNMPITLSASYRVIVDWARPYELTAFDGRNTTFHDWEDPTIKHILQFGVKIYY